MGFTMFACCFLDIMYLVLLLFNNNLLILSHSLILDSSLLTSDVMFLLLSSLNESIVLESVVSSAYTSVLPRPFLQGATPCPFLVTPCLFKKAEMTPCLFDPKKKNVFFFFFWVKKAYNVSGF